MNKLNNKGYMLVEIILAFALAFGLAYFLIELTINLKNKNDDLLVETLTRTDQTIVTNMITDYLDKHFPSFSCNSIVIDGNVITIVDKDGVVQKKNILNEYVTKLSYDASSCKYSYDEETGKGSVEMLISMGVEQLPDENFDVNINHMTLTVAREAYTVTLLSNIFIDSGSSLSLDYGYSGSEVTFNTPVEDNWLLKTWGAQGGDATSGSSGKSITTRGGGTGGYSRGIINTGKPLYVNVGGKGLSTYAYYGNVVTVNSGYNNGDSINHGLGGIKNTNTSGVYTFVGSGGGATHIAMKSGLLYELEDYQEELLIVAGGGGGSTVSYTSSDGVLDAEYGGEGGGYIGHKGYDNYYSGMGGAQTSTYSNSAYSDSTEYMTSFGRGGNYLTGSSYASGGGGGGGYYGGGGGKQYGDSIGAGGGGSGYIKGLSNAWMYGYDATTSSATDTLTYSVDNYSSIAAPNTPKTGDGYAIITTDVGVDDVYYTDTLYYKKNEFFESSTTFTVARSLGLNSSVKCTNGGSATINGNDITVNVSFATGPVVCKLYYAPVYFGTENLLVYYDGANKTGEQNTTYKEITTWTNLAGTNYNGTLYDTTYGNWSNETSYYNEGYGYGAGVLIDGSGSLLTDGSAFTLEAYIDPSGFSYVRDVIANWQSGGYGIEIQTSGKVYFGVYSSTSSSYKGFTSSEALSTTGKYLITATWDGSDKMCLYINGEPVTSSNTNVTDGCLSWSAAGYGTAKFNPATYSSNATLMAVGCDPRGKTCATSGGEFYGYIHSARIYNKALTEDEIKYNYVVDSSKYGTN